MTVFSSLANSLKIFFENTIQNCMNSHSQFLFTKVVTIFSLHFNYKKLSEIHVLKILTNIWCGYFIFNSQKLWFHAHILHKVILGNPTHAEHGTMEHISHTFSLQISGIILQKGRKDPETVNDCKKAVFPPHSGKTDCRS